MKIQLYILLLLGGMMATPLMATQEVTDYSAFRTIPVVHEGRVKPLDTFARQLLVRLYGQDTLDNRTAIEWLAETIFRPDNLITQPIVRIEDKRLVAALGLEQQEHDLYSFEAVAEAFEPQRKVIFALVQKGEEALSTYEKDFLELYVTIHDYSQTLRALTLILPSNITLSPDYSEKIGMTDEASTYLDWLKRKKRITADAEAAAKKHGKNLDAYTEEEKQAALAAFQIANIENTGQQNMYLRIIPDFSGDATQWYAPWALLLEGYGSPQGSALLKDWQQLAHAYLMHDAQKWHTAAEGIKAKTTHARMVDDWQLSLEVLYHRMQPMLWILVCYGLALAGFIAAASKRISPFPASVCLVLGVCLHCAVIVARIAILERPPVSTLYESVLFVSLIAVLLGIAADRKSVHYEGRLMACFLGIGLLLVSSLFVSGGDSLGVVIAVLNTNFWLATHVICITVGYGGALVAGSMAHLYLWNRAQHIGSKLRGATLIALLFTAIGTILGGIWADQSWGRFWGWDPKENGALAIVLWLVWVLHGKITGHLNAIGFATALAVTNIIVALSWFGVNLLNVGLHSYGFTDKAALGLLAFCLMEILIIIMLTVRAKRRSSVVTHAH